MNDELHAARWVTQLDATTVSAFSSAPFAPVGRVVEGRVEPLAAPPARPPGPAGEPESDVALIKTYPGIDPVVIASRCRTREAALEDLRLGAGLAGKVGAMGARGLSPVKARTALMVALGEGGVAAVRDWFGRL